jgi:hypothetical protein
VRKIVPFARVVAPPRRTPAVFERPVVAFAHVSTRSAAGLR